MPTLLVIRVGTGGGDAKLYLTLTKNLFWLSRFLISLAPTHFQFAFDATGSDDRMSQLKPNKGAGGGGWGLGLHGL